MPEDLNPTNLPTLDRLDAMTDDEVVTQYRWWATESHVSLGPDFWLNEIQRRRSERLQEAIRAMVEQSSAHGARTADLVEASGAQNQRMLDLTVRVEKMTLIILVATLVNVGAAIAGLF